jgi:linoleoyl-CoA desaturase
MKQLTRKHCYRISGSLKKWAMSFKINKIAYQQSASATDAVFHTIRTAVHDHLLEKTAGCNHHIWTKAILLLSLSVTFFVVSLISPQVWVIIPCYVIAGWLLLLMGFNLAHDAAHHSLPASKKMNQFIFETVFTLLGANPYLWKIRHIYSHHPYPNVEGCDADIELTTLLRFSQQQEHRSIHRYQHIYAPLLYTIYTLYWIFYKDIILFSRKKQANIVFISHPLKEWVKLFGYKIVYLFIFLGIPLIMHNGSLGTCLVTFFSMHVINSLFLLFTFLISHHVPQTHAAGHSHEQSWLMQQISSSADFHAESKWAYWIFGGFNAHTAHHLFPRVCHVYYPDVTKIIRENLQKHGLPYHSFSFAAGIRYHLLFLKQTGKAPSDDGNKGDCHHCKSKEKCTIRLLKDMIKKAVIILLAPLIAIIANAQQPTFQNLYIIRKGIKPEFREYDYQLNRRGFYIYRNCIYNLTLKNKWEITVKVLDIRNDSLYVVRRNEQGYYDTDARSHHDTFSLHPSKIRAIRYEGFLPTTINRKFRIGHAKYNFEQAEKPKEFKQNISRCYYYDSSISYPCADVAYLENRNIEMHKERAGPETIHKYKPEPLPVVNHQQPLATHKGVWFTPTRSTEITGLNLGLQTANFNQQSLTIRGINLNADFFSVFIAMAATLALNKGNTLINMSDTLESDNIDLKMHGFSISGGGLVGENIVNGVSINGGVVTAVRTNGLVITGGQNLIFDFKGVSICGIRNLSVYGKGLQIGLLNVCKHLKGVQIGLWNVNSKRKLPFINWSF